MRGRASSLKARGPCSFWIQNVKTGLTCFDTLFLDVEAHLVGAEDMGQTTDHIPLCEIGLYRFPHFTVLPIGRKTS